MKAVVYEKYGPPEVLEIREVDKPVPKDNEVLIKIYASAVTIGDVRMRKADPFLVRTFNGLVRPKKKILGINLSGVIEEAGKDVRQFRQGDQVFGSTVFEFGTYAEYVCMPEDGVLAKKPANGSFEEAAVAPFGALTSLHFLKKGDIKQGQRVLVYGASGALGTAAVQLARHFGAVVTGVCSGKNLELVRSLGTDSVIDYTKDDFTEIMDTYDVIFDTVGKCPFFSCLKKLRKGGIFLNAVHVPPLSIIKDLWAMAGNRKVIGGISIERKEDLEFLKKLMEEGEFKPVIDRTYPMEQIVEAHRYVEKGHKRGNVAITISTEEVLSDLLDR